MSSKIIFSLLLRLLIIITFFFTFYFVFQDSSNSDKFAYEVLSFLILFIFIVFEIYSRKNIKEDKTKLYKNLLNLASDSVFIMNKNGELVEFSDNAAKNLGYSKEEFKSKSVFDWDKNLEKNEFDELLDQFTFEPITFERVHTKKNGTTVLVEITASKLDIDDEELFYSSTRDITDLRRNEELIYETNKRQSTLLSLFDSGSLILYRLKVEPNKPFKIEYLSNSVVNLLGYTKEEVLKSNVCYFDFIHEKDYKKTKDKIDEIIDLKINSKIKPYRIITKDNLTKWVSNYIVVEKDKDDNVTHITGISEDVTKEQMTLQNLKKFIDSQENIVLLTNGEEINFANKKFYNFFGASNLDDFKNRYESIEYAFVENERFFNVQKVGPEENWLDAIQSLPESQRVVTMLGSDFKLYAFSISVSDFDNKNYIISFSDISQTMIEKIELEEKTTRDKLTGAFNREYFERNYERIIEEIENSNEKLGVAFLDIDHFKRVNDTFGHDVGDDVLIHFVKTVNKSSREHDTLIRWGGEEFILLLRVTNENRLEDTLERIRHNLEKEKFPTIGNLTCSIGATVYQDNEDIDKTIKRADESVYDAKTQGRNRVIIS